MPEPKTILVVDDDPLLRAGLQTMLQHHGYLTLAAEDGQDARDLIDGHQPDLVILDMMMPRWGGLAVLEHFQGKADSPPFIMISAHEGEKHKAYAQLIGAIDYLRKPFSFESLLERVDQLLVPEQAEEDEAAEASAQTPLIRISCPRCGARIKAPLKLLLHTRPCPRCHLALVIKPESPEDEGPKLMIDP